MIGQALVQIQISEHRPTFYVRELPALANIAGRSERDLVIVRFDKKKDHRELQTTSGGNMFTFTIPPQDPQFLD